MYLDEFRNYCLALPGVTECFPFDENTLVYKVENKVFALTDVELFDSINLKCDPGRAVELRESSDAIQPGYHMNKKHWNTILLDGSLSDTFIRELIEHSYELVFQKLPRKVRDGYQNR